MGIEIHLQSIIKLNMLSIVFYYNMFNLNLDP